MIGDGHILKAIIGLFRKDNPVLNVNQTGSIARSILVAIGAFAVGRGWITNDQVLQWTPIILSVGAALWGVFVHTKTQTVVAAADIVAIPPGEQVKAGVVTPQLVPTSPKAV